MKIKTLLIALLCGLMMSCGSDEDDINAAGGNFTAKIDGTEWSGSSNTVITSILNNFLVAIGAGRADQSSMALTLNISSKSTGTYTTADNGAFGGTYIDSDGNVFMSSTGSITITKFEETSISGTFNFTASTLAGQTITVTDGEFTDVNIQN